MVYFAKIGTNKVINIEHVTMITLVDGGSRIYLTGQNGESVLLNENETQQLIDDIDHAATLYRIQQNIQEH